MTNTPLGQSIENLIEPTLNHMGFEIVRVAISGAKSLTVQVMAERPDGTLSIDDCEEISKTVSTLLDVEDLIEDAYRLEVSSPGLDRPLTRPAHFDRYKGFEAKVEMDDLIDNRKRFSGLLAGMDGKDILLTIDGTDIRLPFARMQRAKLLMTDDLVRHALRQDKKKQEEKRKTRKDDRAERINNRKRGTKQEEK